MHVSSSDFQAVRRDGVLIHYAILGGMAYAFADLPAGGSAGTFVEDWIRDPLWAFVIAGDIQVDLDGERHPIPPGTAFHVPAGVRHRLLAAGAARLAGFSRIEPGTPTSEVDLRQAGFEVLGGAATVATPGARSLTVHRSRPERPPARREIIARSTRMGDLLFTRARLGPTAGYTSSLCDVPHWGLVTSGSLAIESEDGVEVVTAGEAFHCPPGPPAHRLQAADPAVIVDLTPVDALLGAERLAEWRRVPADKALAVGEAAPRLELAALV